MKNVASKLSLLPRQLKKVIFLIHDTLLSVPSLWLATLFTGMAADLGSYGAVILASAVSAVIFRLPWIKLSSFQAMAILRIAAAALLVAVCAGLTLHLVHGDDSARAVETGALTAIIYFALLVLIRAVELRALLSLNEDDARERVAIYGAGTAGIQLAAALLRSDELRPVLFLDDNPNLHKLMIGDLPVRSPHDLDDLRRRYRFDTVFLSIPSIAETRRNEIAEALASGGVKVRVMPSLLEMLARSQHRVDDITPNELLGRESVQLDSPEIARTYAGKTVMVTGAGGSIGSELCRQLLSCQVKTIVLFEHSEFALYSIERELKARAGEHGARIIARLGSIKDGDRVRQILRETNPEIILHAAAYKHVPIIEDNPLEAAKNNILGTLTVVEAAIEAGVGRFILISTDKAVRPTNIMGASKRMAEQIVQEAQHRAPGTMFSMVRFGNVLGSSGSVLPVFQQQIQSGGPVTVTHPEVTRYFMTIPEASRLVLLAGAYAEGSDVFVLDMGEPRLIADLARQMIHLSGRTVRDPETGIGDIEIRFTGLRPGEKLYEELLIGGDNLLPTPHAKIMRAQERMASREELDAFLASLRDCLTRRDRVAFRALIARHVEGFHVETAT